MDISREAVRPPRTSPRITRYSLGLAARETSNPFQCGYSPGIVPIARIYSSERNSAEIPGLQRMPTPRTSDRDCARESQFQPRKWFEIHLLAVLVGPLDIRTPSQPPEKLVELRIGPKNLRKPGSYTGSGFVNRTISTGGALLLHNNEPVCPGLHSRLCRPTTISQLLRFTPTYASNNCA